MALTSEQERQIQYYKDQWEQANARGDEAAKADAHAQAEAIRNSAGYSGGASGDEYLPSPSSNTYTGSAAQQANPGQTYTSIQVNPNTVKTNYTPAQSGTTQVTTHSAISANQNTGTTQKAANAANAAEVKATQKMLQDAGYYLGPSGIDGIWGNYTQKAWEAYLYGLDHNDALAQTLPDPNNAYSPNTATTPGLSASIPQAQQRLENPNLYSDIEAELAYQNQMTPAVVNKSVEDGRNHLLEDIEAELAYQNLMTPARVTPSPSSPQTTTPTGNGGGTTPLYYTGGTLSGGGGGAATTPGMNDTQFTGHDSALDGMYNPQGALNLDWLPPLEEWRRQTEELINQKNQILLEAQQGQVDEATRKAVDELNAQIEASNQMYSQLIRQNAYNSAQARDNIALMNRAAGNMGGIGAKLYSDQQASFDAELYNIKLEQINAINEANRAIADYIAQGDYQKAQLAAQLGAQAIAEIMEREDAFINSYYNSYWNEQNLAYDYANMNFNQFMQKLNSGMFNANDAVALGIDPSQAQSVADYYNSMMQINKQQAQAALAQQYASLNAKKTEEEVEPTVNPNGFTDLAVASWKEQLTKNGFVQVDRNGTPVNMYTIGGGSGLVDAAGNGLKTGDKFTDVSGNTYVWVDQGNGNGDFVNEAAFNNSGNSSATALANTSLLPSLKSQLSQLQTQYSQLQQVYQSPLEAGEKAAIGKQMSSLLGQIEALQTRIKNIAFQ